MADNDTPRLLPDPLPPHVQHMRATTRACPRCATIDFPALADGTATHWRRLLCRHCQCWIQWVSRYSDEERLARRKLALMATKAPTDAQLGYLAGLGYRGPTPGDRAVAYTLIEQLKKKRGMA